MAKKSKKPVPLPVSTPVAKSRDAGRSRQLPRKAVTTPTKSRVGGKAGAPVTDTNSATIASTIGGAGQDRNMAVLTSAGNIIPPTATPQGNEGAGGSLGRAGNAADMPAARAFDQVGTLTGVSPMPGGVAIPHEPNDELPKPKPGERTSGQTPLIGGAALSMPLGIMGNLAAQAGGTPWAGWGAFQTLWNQAFPGTPFTFAGTWWGWYNNASVQPRKGGYVPYRFMSLDPTLRLVKALIVNPILSSQWEIKPRKGISIDPTGATIVKDTDSAAKKILAKSAGPKPASGGPNSVPSKAPTPFGRVISVPQWHLDVLTDMVLPLRNGVLPECLRYMESGWRPFERVYSLRDGAGSKLYWLDKLKPLLPDYSLIMDGGSGNYGGLTCKGAALGPRKSWIASYDVEAGNLYGYSRHEAAFDPWLDKQYARVRAAMLTSKLAGVLPIVYYRPGTTPTPDVNGVTAPKDNFKIATEICNMLFGGSGAVCPTTEYTDEDLQMNPELAGLAPWKIEIVNAGSYAPAIDGIIRERQYLDTLLIRAWCWPERAVAEAQTGGSRADSEQHTDSASFDREMIDDDIAQQLSHGQPCYDVLGVIDEIAVLNWGEDARGIYEIVPAPLVDSKVEVYETLLKAALSNPNLATSFASVVRWDDVFNHLDIATAEDVKDKLPQLIQNAMDQQKQQSDAQAQQTKVQLQAGGVLNPRGRISMNGTGGMPPKNKKQPANGNQPTSNGNRISSAVNAATGGAGGRMSGGTNGSKGGK